MHATNFAMAEDSRDNLLQKMQSLLGAMLPEDQDAFTAELNVSAQAMLEQHNNNATTVVNLT